MTVRLELPYWKGDADDPARVLAAVDAWAGSAELRRIVRAFGEDTAGWHDPGSPDATLRGAALLDWLDRFSSEQWDFRGGAERNLAPVVTLSREIEVLVLDTARELGLAGPYPLHNSGYDTLLMTGGMIRAEIVKPRSARELLDSGVAVKSVVFLGGFRPFAGDEIELAPVFGIRGDNEFDAMVNGMELTFGPLGDPLSTEGGVWRGSADWRVCRWRRGGLELKVVAAPSSDPGHRRANTADTYRFWADSVRTSRERSVLVVTTPIYVPYQGAVAVELLGVDRGLAVETVGVSREASDLGEHSQLFLAQNHLQEIRSAIRALRNLRARLTAGEMSGPK